MSLTPTPPRIHVLAKPAGAVCNLDCKYCFFLSKEKLYLGSRFRMAEHLLQIYLRQLLQSHRGPEVVIAWQGGEPTLMGRDFFIRSIEHVKRFQRPGQKVQYTIQTNGILLDDDWCAFFKQHNFLVGLSVDGPKQMYDAYRVDKSGKGTFDKVKQAWERTRQAADRTFMAWVRTSLSLIGFGFGIAQYRDILLNAGFIQRPPEEFNTTLIFGLSFISLGVFGLAAAVMRHWRILQAIKHDPLAFPVFKPLSMVMAVILLLIGGFAFAAVLKH